MKKRILAIAITVCLLFTALTCVANAALAVSVGKIATQVRVCPGKSLSLDAPEVEGFVSSFGWEIQTADGVWIPYDGGALTEADNGKLVRYYVAAPNGDYYYSSNADGSESVCVVEVAHNPQGAYHYDGMNHWRDCADCGGQADKSRHTTLEGSATAGDKVCKVCGHIRTSQYTGILTFWEWLMALLQSLIH